MNKQHNIFHEITADSKCLRIKGKSIIVRRDEKD